VIRGLSDFDNMINPDNHRIQFYSNFGQALGQQQTYDEIWWGVWIYWNTYIKAEDGGQGQGWAQIYESISNPNNNYDATALFLKSNAGYTANILEAFVNYRNVGSSGIVSQRGTTELPLQQWFHLEARVRFRNDNTGQFQVWINGVEEFNLSGRTQDAASDWSYLNPVQLYGQKTGAGTMGEALVYWDDVIVADERIWTMEGYGNGGGGNGQILPPPAARRMIGLVPMGLR
jgi:hypothetical protein